MNKKYVVLSGDESGIELEKEFVFMNKQMAEITFDEYMTNNGCAAMYEYSETKLILIKKQHNF
ncbi:hypothetical protein M0Q50_06795 [bacterium]|jgi:hypothetical protein|nr:hypothetical protein [bacterium]